MLMVKAKDFIYYAKDKPVSLVTKEGLDRISRGEELDTTNSIVFADLYEIDDLDLEMELFVESCKFIVLEPEDSHFRERTYEIYASKEEVLFIVWGTV